MNRIIWSRNMKNYKMDSKIKIVNGKIKWNEKNRFNVALLIENPPQIHSTIIFPI